MRTITMMKFRKIKYQLLIHSKHLLDLALDEYSRKVIDVNYATCIHKNIANPYLVHSYDTCKHSCELQLNNVKQPLEDIARLRWWSPGSKCGNHFADHLRRDH